MTFKKLVVVLIFLLVVGKIMSQLNPFFYSLNTTNGLSYIGVNDMCIDKKGNLWIATGNGLNMFNGKTVDKYFASEYPQLQSSNILHVTCDDHNRIWILTIGGYISMLDESRQMHRVSIYKNNEWIKPIWIFNTLKFGISIYASKGNYIFNSHTSYAKADSIDQNYFTFLPLKEYDSVGVKGYNRAFSFDDNSYLLMYEDVFFKINHQTNTVEKKIFIPHLTALLKWGDNELLAFDQVTKEIKAINLITREQTYPFRNLRDQAGQPVNADFRNAEKLNENEYIFTTYGAGIYIYNRRTGTINNYRHSVSNPYSLGNNAQNAVAVTQTGWVFIACNPNGISYLKINEVVNNQYMFTSADGKGYDGNIAGIATKDNNTYYIGTSEGMLEWKRNTNTTKFINLKDQDGKPIFKDAEVSSVLIDNTGNIWATVYGDGLIVMDKDQKLIKRLRNEKGNQNSLKQKAVWRLQLGPDGFIWAFGQNGVCRINTRTFEIDNFENTPLQQFDSLYVEMSVFIDKDNLWLFVSPGGLYHYNIPAKKLDEHPGFRKYKNESAFDIQADSSGNIYIGNTYGLKIFFKDGREKVITKKNGLLIDRVEGLLLDKYNRMWIGNDIGLVCYDPADSSLRVFDERYGLSVYGFRVGSYFRTPNGEFIFGTPRGVQYFHPDSLYNKKISLNVLISKIETKNVVSNITDNAEFKLPARDDQVTFYFNSVDFSPHVRTYYEYKLVDLDKDWIKIADQNSVRYNLLPPGKYVFKVRISNDNKNWQESDNEVAIVVAAPFYQTWWFKTIGIILGLLLIWYVLKYYQRKQMKQREELETELVINYFASQINKHHKTDEMLWDIAKNCISKLNFEDCVIYLLDEERNVLVQKAAYGPKMERDFSIYNPIEIPLGKGIVGTVAQTGKPELIGNTELDKRYIADDARRYAELAVPLIVDNRIIGVIDSEHSQKNFFKQKHLNILKTVAVLCAAQIQRVKAEEEKQQAKIETIQNKQKMTESRLQSLRLQMNPHFLFNALNSIQQMILANEEMVATRYLSKFSKLLRTILVHSDREFVTLKEELEILHLYIELESIRFKDSFKYSIECEDEIDTDEVKLPTLLIQPFVENAIWHGLMHKEGDRLLQVKFFESQESLHCIVEDNGIGREKASEAKLATGQGKKHTSKGIQVSMERLMAMNNGNGRESSLQIFDLKDENGRATGTRVEIIFPIQNN
jgi:ligand-binding sensor domain-containing protein/putative methionine-R-sulfoxide reductase with GAF domain